MELVTNYSVETGEEALPAHTSAHKFSSDWPQASNQLTGDSSPYYASNNEIVSVTFPFPIDHALC